jgi:YidC/Oxa1 family membrane protein insertase
MNLITFLIAEVLFRPVYNILIIFLEVFEGNLGWAIIFLTLVVRLILLKPSLKSTDMQKSMWSLQPKMQELQQKYKDQPEKLSQETMKLLKKEGGGPLKWCLSMVIQIPVFIGLLAVIRKISADQVPVEWLYSFFSGFGANFLSLDTIDTIWIGQELLASKNVVITVLAAIFTYVQMKLVSMVRPQTPSLPGASMPDMSKMMGFMNIFLVFIMGSFVYSQAAAIGLYIMITSLFSVVQYVVQYRVLVRAKLQTLFVKKK